MILVFVVVPYQLKGQVSMKMWQHTNLVLTQGYLDVTTVLTQGYLDVTTVLTQGYVGVTAVLT